MLHEQTLRITANSLCFKPYVRKKHSLISDLYHILSSIYIFADDKLNVTQTMTFVLQRVENIVGKPFSPFSQDVFKGLLSHVR